MSKPTNKPDDWFFKFKKSHGATFKAEKPAKAAVKKFQETVEKIAAPDLVDSIHTYKRLKLEIKRLEEKANVYRDELMKEAIVNGGELTVDVWRLSVIEVDKNSFDLKRALEALGTQILRPYIKTSSYKRLNIS